MGLTAVRDVCRQSTEYLGENSRVNVSSSRVMNHTEDIAVLVSVMREHFGDNEVNIARDSKGFNSFSALPIQEQHTGTRRFLDAWGTTQSWVDTVLAGTNNGHLFMDQPEFDDWEVDANTEGAAEDPIADDIQAAAVLGGSSDSGWVENAIRQWDRSHEDKEGAMGECD